MNDEALFNPARWKDSLTVSYLLSDTANRLIASEKPLVLMRYQPDVLRAMGNLAAELWDKFGDVWLFFAFFHSDRDTLVISRTPQSHTGREQRKAALEQKAEWILSLGRFPFVKMVETSIKDVIEFKALQKLFTEYAPER